MPVITLRPVITGELKSKIDRVWDAFWSGGISNPLEVIEQITYLLFIRRLDDLQTLAEKKARVTGEPIEDPIFLPGQQHLRWSRFKNDEPDGHVQDRRRRGVPVPARARRRRLHLLRAHEGRPVHHPDPGAAVARSSTCSTTSRWPTATPTATSTSTCCPRSPRAGVNGQFRTPRHIIKLMVEMTAPQPTDEICDPACGTAGFLVAASRVRPRAAPVGADRRRRSGSTSTASMFHGYDFDSTMLRIGSMNMLLHGIESPDIRYRDSLSEGASEDAEKYTLILANPPFAGSLDYESTSKDLQRVVKTKKTELLFLALFLKLLKPGGRAAVIVPDGVLFGSSNGAQGPAPASWSRTRSSTRVVKLPSGVFRPYAGVSTAILFFTKTNSGGTDDVWFYDVRADGFSLDDKRNPVEANDLPDVLARWAIADDDRARAGPHRAVVLRAEGRHRRPGLRPLAQPLQGDRPRRGRAPRRRWRSSPTSRRWRMRSPRGSPS